ncbi:DUF4062 domain-containing protein [Raoultella ornithinolytica]|uniref:DUF4062 domain-containing protein n=1 Tax=Raoultella ornithinolytica TaxID=54291 RepID=UPI002DBBD46D|nr:DUF4062 domain-containing protein [Raoultella ornithinolytica]MEB8015699.1 DUF4062 domain-containing protein [Raoultella ornithinolytica]
MEKKFQVFLSSTYTDLVEERESIIKAVLELYHIPIGMEMFSAEDEDQWEIIRRTIEVSDYYILVLGLRYGSKTSDGISFTHKEYNYALEKKIPILAFLMNDSVALPGCKRDDDLTDIKGFRETVLANSKMAQFWDTKDQLVKNVSVSLMKQIMQKPGIGWIRGDNTVVSESLSNELSILSKENRELREKIALLESKVEIKKPDIKLYINHPSVDEKFNSFAKISMPEVLNINNIEPHLLEFITEDDIALYNSHIPSEFELEQFNIESEKYFKIKNYSTALRVEVSNEGTAKANNIFIELTFPTEILIYKLDENPEEPTSPIPFDPLANAQARYQEKQDELNFQKSRSIYDSLYMNGLATMNNFNNANFFRVHKPANISSYTFLEGNTITIKIDSLIHTRLRAFSDEYMIVPLSTGNHIVKADIICEEYTHLENVTIEIQV